MYLYCILKIFKRFTYSITHLYIPIQNKVNHYLVTVFSTVAWLLIKTDMICNIYIIVITNIAMCIHLYVGIYKSKLVNNANTS